MRAFQPDIVDFLGAIFSYPNAVPMGSPPMYVSVRDPMIFKTWLGKNVTLSSNLTITLSRISIFTNHLIAINCFNL